MIALNIFAVRRYGESEFVMAVSCHFHAVKFILTSAVYQNPLDHWLNPFDIHHYGGWQSKTRCLRISTLEAW